MATSEFNSYRIYYQSTPVYNWQSRVYLYKDGAYAGRLMFMKEGVALPENNESSSGQPTIYFPTSSFEEVMDILRNEKPLYITISSSKIGTVSTSNEPVGEEEDD